MSRWLYWLIACYQNKKEIQDSIYWSLYKWVESVIKGVVIAQITAKAIVLLVIYIFVPEKTVITNKWRNFESILIKKICKICNIQKIKTKSFDPQSIWQAERIVLSIKEKLKILITESDIKWDEEFPISQYSLKIIQSNSLKISPSEMLFCRCPRTLSESRYEIYFKS